MTQFDFFKNTNHSTKALYPCLIEIQSNLLSDLQTTVVIPLTPIRQAIKNLHPIFDISGN